MTVLSSIYRELGPVRGGFSGTHSIKITSGLVQIAPHMRSFYTEDPDGVPVEFLQVTK